MHFLKTVRTRFRSYHLKSGIFHFNRGEFKQAAEFFKRALKEDGLRRDEERTSRSFLTQTYLGWAEELAEQGDRVGALEKYEAALGIAHGYADGHCRRGILLRDMGRLDEAREAFERALEINGNFVGARFQLGQVLLDTGLPEDAAAEFERAFVLNIKRIERPFFEGKALLLEGETDLGRELIRKAFDHRPHEADRQFREGLRALRAEQWQDAIDRLQCALDMDDGYADVHNYLGVAFQECGREEEALAAFRRSLEINPRFQAARLNLASLLFERGEIEAAESELETILLQEPDCTPALDCREELARRRPATRRA